MLADSKAPWSVPRRVGCTPECLPDRCCVKKNGQHGKSLAADCCWQDSLGSQFEVEYGQSRPISRRRMRTRACPHEDWPLYLRSRCRSQCTGSHLSPAGSSHSSHRLGNYLKRQQQQHSCKWLGTLLCQCFFHLQRCLQCEVMQGKPEHACLSCMSGTDAQKHLHEEQALTHPQRRR